MTLFRHVKLAALSSVGAFSLLSTSAMAQDILPTDNGLYDYHTSPRYRESESHPLRVLAYLAHPIGWVAREVIFRPLSYFASSTPETRSIMGYREPYDFRKPSCFVRGDEIPDCREVPPFNYDTNVGRSVDGDARRALYIPDTNFDFNVRRLNAQGKARVRAAAEVLKREGALKVVLEGHADERGGDSYNMKLGLDRAEAVKNELISLGISPTALSTVSFGESRPLFNEKEEWAYAANRRVEIKIDDKKASDKATK